MATSIALAEKFQPILDEIYKKASLTSNLDALTKPIDFGGVATVSIFKTSMVGLGDYDRATGYPAGDVTGTWEAITLTHERGREFVIDRMDNEESLGMAFGTLAGEFIRTQVVPEIDAIRFAAWAAGAGQVVGTPATLDSSSVLPAITVAAQALDDAEVPSEGRLLYVSSSVYGFIKAAVTRSLGNEAAVDRRVLTLDGVPVIPVPQGRFYDSITLDAGATSNAGGFVKTATTGADLNFVLLHPSAREQAVKLANLKVFSPDENQTSDGWKFQYRLYHDAWVYDNKVNGIYIHKKVAG